MTAETRQTYTAELKREAVRLGLAPGDARTEAARHWGSNATRLGGWTREVAAQAHGVFPGQGRVSPAQEALSRLRAAPKRLRRAREMLQHAAACVANESTAGLP